MPPRRRRHPRPRTPPTTRVTTARATTPTTRRLPTPTPPSPGTIRATTTRARTLRVTTTAPRPIPLRPMTPVTTRARPTTATLATPVTRRARTPATAASTPAAATTENPTLRLELRSTPELDADVRNAASGDGVALRRLYDALSPKIVGYLRLRGAEDPEGLTNDVFLSLFLRLDKLKGGWEGFRALAFTIAHSRMVDDRRRQARQPRHEQYDAQYDGRVDTSAEQQALEEMNDGGTVQLLQLLPEDQRSVVMLRILGDLSVAQTAE